MTREEARRENARRLANSAGGKAEFARLLAMEPSQVSHIIGPKPKKNIGNSIARRIELAFQLQPFALDDDHPEFGTADVEVEPSDLREVKNVAQPPVAAPESLQNGEQDDAADPLDITCETFEEIGLLTAYRLAKKVGDRLTLQGFDNVTEEFLARAAERKKR